MSHLVVLSQSSDAVAGGYDIRLGPLRFVTPADTVGETIGDGLEAVGAALVAAERRPRPLKLKLPVRGDHLAPESVEAGQRLRRQVRQLIDNARWRMSGLYFVWDADPDLDGWLLIGGAELSETDPGVSFGEYEMELSDVYIVGRPGTHRPGRRASIGDRRGGLVSRDSRRLLYSTDFSAQALPTEPLIVPGDVVDLVASGNRPIGTTVAGPLRSSRRLWRACSASDAEIISYLPDEAVLLGRDRYLELDELGSVRVWDLSGADPYPPSPGQYTTERDTSPDLYWGWERLLGDVLSADRPLAIDNGAVRLIWLGAAANEGLAVEYWDDTLGHYRRDGRVLHALGVREQRVVEATPERAVIEWRAGQYGMRAILQRGWWGPRLESFDDGGGTARLEYAPSSGALAPIVVQTPSWVRRVNGGILDDFSSNSIADYSFDAGGGTLTVANGQLVPSDTSAKYFHRSAAPSTYLSAQATLKFTTGASVAGSFFVAVVPLRIDANNLVYGQVQIFGASSRLRIYKLDAGAFTQLALSGTFAVAAATSYWLRVRRAGNAIEVELWTSAPTTGGSPAQTFSHTLAGGDSTKFGTGVSGKVGGRLDSCPTDYRFDDLQIVDLGDSGGMLWASGSNDEVVDTTPTIVTGPAATFRRTRVLVAQLGFPPGPTATQLASLSLVDARPVPVLIGRR